LILGFFWTLFKKFRIQTIKQDDKSSEEGLLLWCKKATEGYRDCKVETFRTSFRDGMPFAALVDKFVDSDKSIIDYDSFKKENAAENLTRAFDLAETKLGIPKLLEPAEVTEGNVDERSLVLYISLFFHAFVAKQQQRGLLDEKERIERERAGLAGSLEERAKQAQVLQDENLKLRDEIEQLKASLKTEQEARAELQEKDTYLEEKVEVLKQLFEQENEEKQEIEKAKAAVEKELEDLRAKFAALTAEGKEKDKLIESLRDELDGEKKKNQSLSESKSLLEQEVAGLHDSVSGLSTKLEQEQQARKKENEEQALRNKAEVDGLNVLKKNLNHHVEDLHAWQKLLELNGELDFSGELRPQILLDIHKENFNQQLEYLAKKLEHEDAELMKLWKMKEVDVKARKAKEAKKKSAQQK